VYNNAVEKFKPCGVINSIIYFDNASLIRTTKGGIKVHVQLDLKTAILESLLNRYGQLPVIFMIGVFYIALLYEHELTPNADPSLFYDTLSADFPGP